MAARNAGTGAPGKTEIDRAGHDALRRLAEADAPEVLEAARRGARERARAILEDALIKELLTAVDRSERPASGDESASAWWAYCVMGAERAREVAAGLSGVEPGSPVEAVAEGDLAALVSPVSVTDYGDDRLREHLEDIAWLERTARAHEAVQQAVLGREALVPLRLCTIYRDVEGVRLALRENAEVFARNLAALAGAKEWGVKVFVCPSTVPPAAAEPDSGTAYLAGRQRERDHAAQLDELGEQCVDEVRRAVGALSIDERVNPVQHPEAHGRDAEMIFNGATLVADDHVAELRSTLSSLERDWAERGLLVELTGPWPPYNFVFESAGAFS